MEQNAAGYCQGAHTGHDAIFKAPDTSDQANVENVQGMCSVAFADSEVRTS